MPDLDLQPHHDGSALYVANQRPQLGDKIKIRIRIHNSIGKLKQVLIRKSDSGQSVFTPAVKPLIHRHGWDWYEGVIVISNPEVHYRFFLENTKGESFWLNATGFHDLDQPDRDDFRINTHNTVPKWATGAILYQVMPDRFARSAQADKREAPLWAEPKTWNSAVKARGNGVNEQFFGGDLKGIEDHLDHLKKVGATILQLTPFFPAGSSHRYDARSFDQVDPVLGGNSALASLVSKAHEMGIKVIGELSLNHSANTHEWFVSAFKEPSAPESGFYYFAERNTIYDSWRTAETRPKFNWGSAEIRKRLIEGKASVIARGLKAPFQLDGWRIAEAGAMGRLRQDDYNQQVANTVRETMTQANADSLLIGEFGSDSSDQVQGHNFSATLSYANFTKPTWRWLWNTNQYKEEAQIGLGRKAISGDELRQLHNCLAGTSPWHLRLHNLNALDTHETGRFKTFAIPGAQRVAAGLQFTFPGIPHVYAGDELGLDAETGEGSRTPMPWNGERETDSSMIETYAKLSQIRKRHRGLTEGSMRWLYASNEAIAFVRESKTESVLVIASRGRERKLEFSRDAISGVEGATNLFGHGSLRVVGGKIRYDAAELDLQIWRLPSAVR
jgi:alpha-glucosidase